MESKKLDRREFLRLSVLTAAGAALASCGPAPTPEVIREEVPVEVTRIIEKEGETVVEEVIVTATPPPMEPVVIRFTDTASVIANEQVYKPVYDNFREAHPAIEVKWLSVPPGDAGWAGYFDKLQVMVAGGDSPDIGKIPTEGGRLAAARGLITPIDDYIAATPEMDEYFDDVSPHLAKVFVYGGKTYSLPYDYAPMVIWFNTKRLEEEGLDIPPEDWTFADFLEYAKALTKIEGGRITHYGFQFWTSPFGLCPWLFNNGLPGMMGGDTMEKPLMTDPAYVEVVQFLYDMAYKYEVSPRPDVEEIPSFEAGTVGMVMQGRWNLITYLQNEFYDFDIQYWPTGTRRVTEVGCGSWPIFAASDHKDEAWTWMSFLLSKESIALITKETAVPSRRSVGYSEDLLKWPPERGHIWYESIDRDDIPVISVTSPPDFSEMMQISDRYLSLILANELSVEEGLEQTQEGMEEMVARRPETWVQFF
jgi:multiple sugar transport system substrate-binding protein